LGSKSSQFRQIGNAIAVGFAFHLGKVLKEFEQGKLEAKPISQIELNL
jgi:site-specific DNA-cytosine methylase